jgi:hypothetical protein
MLQSGTGCPPTNSGDDVNITRCTLSGLLALAVVACTGKNPGPLEGTWHAKEPFPVTVSFRDGETESMGRIRKVSYARAWGEVSVTYQEGTDAETSFVYTLIDDDTIRSDSGTFHRVR